MDKSAYMQGYGDFLKTAFHIAAPHSVEKRAAKLPVKPIGKLVRGLIGTGAVAAPTAVYLSIPPTAKYPKELRPTPQSDSPFNNKTLDNAASALKHLYVDGPNSKLVAGVTAGLVLGIPATIAGYRFLKNHNSSSREKELRRQMAMMGYRL